jgi:DNA-binding transcriptional ArsR family regulator
VSPRGNQGGHTSGNRAGHKSGMSRPGIYARAGPVTGRGAEDRAGAVFGALSDPTRRALLATIAKHPATTATELAAQQPISRQAVLKHLNALTDAGLLDRTRSGREVRYQFTPAPLSDAVDWMTAVGAEWDERLAVLRRQLGGGGRAAPRGSSRRVQHPG